MINIIQNKPFFIVFLYFWLENAALVSRRVKNQTQTFKGYTFPKY